MLLLCTVRLYVHVHVEVHVACVHVHVHVHVHVVVVLLCCCMLYVVLLCMCMHVRNLLLLRVHASLALPERDEQALPPLAFLDFSVSACQLALAVAPSLQKLTHVLAARLAIDISAETVRLVL